jgi:hypothetical protein
MSVFPANLTDSAIQKATLVLYVNNGGNPGTISICQVSQALVGWHYHGNECSAVRKHGEGYVSGESSGTAAGHLHIGGYHAYRVELAHERQLRNCADSAASDVWQ